MAKESVKNKFTEFVQSLLPSKPSLDLDNIRKTFHRAMRDAMFEREDSDGRGHNSTKHRDKTVLTEKLTSLSGLVKWGLYDSQDFQLNEETRLSDIFINGAIAQTIFEDGPIHHLGFRAILARPVSFDDNLMIIRYELEYYPNSESDKRSIYFQQVTTLRQYFDEIKEKLFKKGKNGEGYVPKEHLTVIVYGEWIAHGCNWCKMRNRIKTECAEESHCEKFVYETRITAPKLVYAEKKKHSKSWVSRKRRPTR